MAKIQVKDARTGEVRLIDPSPEFEQARERDRQAQEAQDAQQREREERKEAARERIIEYDFSEVSGKVAAAQSVAALRDVIEELAARLDDVRVVLGMDERE
jgi:hypothetical protein